MYLLFLVLKYLSIQLNYCWNAATVLYCLELFVIHTCESAVVSYLLFNRENRSNIGQAYAH